MPRKKKTWRCYVILSVVIAAMFVLVAVYDAAYPVFTRLEPVERTYTYSKTFPQYGQFIVFTIETQEFHANSWLSGNMTICCRQYPPGGDMYGIPAVFILTSAQYSLLKGQPGNDIPTNDNYVATTFGRLDNYTYSGATGTETLTLRIFIKETALYYFVVIGRGETEFTLNLKVTSLQEVHPYEFYFRLAAVVTSLLSLFSAIIYRRAP